MEIIKIFKLVLVIIGFMFLTGLWYISPILKSFPELTGPYHVGYETLYFVDQDRFELFSETSVDKRFLVGHFLYPADAIANSKRASYVADKMLALQKNFAELYSIPEWLSKLLFRDITTHAYVNTPISRNENNYPVILFSHGLLGMPSDMYMVILQDLASHGYIVVGIDHPYFNIITLSSEGNIIRSNVLTQKFNNMSPYEQQQFQSKAIEVYKDDIRFLLDELAKINQDEKSIFYHRLDLERIGIMGHSAGGTAAIEFCRNDARCKAVVNLDGWYGHIIENTPLKQPLLLLFGSKSIEIAEPTPEYLKRKQITREQYFDREQKIVRHREQLCATDNCTTVILPGVSHGDFGDSLLLKWPLRSWNDASSYKTIALINEYIVQFFDRYL